MLGADPGAEEQLVLGSRDQRAGRGPPGQVDVAASQRPVGQHDSDVAERAGRVGAQLLGPVPLAGRGVGQRGAAHQFEGGHQGAVPDPVHPRREQNLEPVPVRADAGVQQIRAVGFRRREDSIDI